MKTCLWILSCVQIIQSYQLARNVWHGHHFNQVNCIYSIFNSPHTSPLDNSLTHTVSQCICFDLHVTFDRFQGWAELRWLNREPSISWSFPVCLTSMRASTPSEPRGLYSLCVCIGYWPMYLQVGQRLTGTSFLPLSLKQTCSYFNQVCVFFWHLESPKSDIFNSYTLKLPNLYWKQI